MRFPDKGAKLALTALPPIFLAIALSLLAQTLTPGEVRLSSRPYVPQSPIRVQTRLVELEVVVRLRIVVQEAVHGAMSATTKELQIP
jgi:hypothetical protein